MYTLSHLREARDAVLAQTDFLLLPDIVITQEEKDLVVLYRQSLRDITEGVGDEVESIDIPIIASDILQAKLGQSPPSDPE
jgi:hypothetical protein